MITSSFIICTKDRPEDLQKCVESILEQTVLPQECIVVDASANSTENENNCKRIINKRIKFMHIKSEPSTTKQRNIGVDNSRGDIVFFLDDDVILDKEYHEKMLSVYRERSGDDVGGVRGTIGNEEALTQPKLFLRRFFMLTRYSVNEESKFLPSGNYVYIPQPKEIIEVECMPSGVCSYYKKVFNEFRFDETLNGYALKEDMELSYRVSRKYKLYQTPYAILYHYNSRTGRMSIEESAALRIINSYYLFKKNMPRSFFNNLCFSWSLLGTIIIDFIRLLTHQDTENIRGSLKGIAKII